MAICILARSNIDITLGGRRVTTAFWRRVAPVLRKGTEGVPAHCRAAFNVATYVEWEQVVQASLWET